MIPQNEINEAALEHAMESWGVYFDDVHPDCAINDSMGEIAIKDFKAEVEFAEFKFEELFPNGFDSWQETHYEVVSKISWIMRECIDFNYPRLKDVAEHQGTGGLYELAKELTNKFELLNRGRQWDGEFFDEIDEFLEKELYGE